jgi:glycosyltransferase involved in cell wall biosynthesis
MANEYWRNEMNQNAMSGSEMMMTELEQNVDSELLSNFQIVLSRPELHDLDETKIRILWCHDLPEDPQVASYLQNGGWSRFHRYVFVSNWQAQRFIERYGIPWNRTIVLSNAINPIDVGVEDKWSLTEDDTIRFVYHTTPHRGLGILVPVFEHIAEQIPNIHLDVFSSFSVYGWQERDEQFKPIFDRIEESEYMTYHGGQPNDVVRRFLRDEAHVFAYPNIWPETSCRALIEAMSAGCVCVHPNYGALFETAGKFTFMYHFDNEAERHAGVHHQAIVNSIGMIRSEDIDALKMKLSGQKSYADVNYSWEIRQHEWTAFLQNLLQQDLPREIETASSGEVFSYEVNY